MSEIVQDKPPVSTDGSPVITDSPSDQAAFEAYMGRSKSVLSDENTERQAIEREAGIQSPAVILDPNIDNKIVNTTPDIPAPVVPPVVPAEPKVEVDLLDKLLGQETPAATPIETPATPITSYTPDQVAELVASARAEEALKWEEANTVFKQYEQNPYEFLAKQAPHLFKNFDTEGYVNEKLSKEFGEDFVPNPEDSLKYNSPSNKYLKRQMQLEQEAEGLQRTAGESETQTQQTTKQQRDDFKQSVMTKYGFESQADFDPLWNELSAMTGEQVWETLVKYKLLVKNADTIKKNLRQSPAKGFGTPGITDLAGAPNQLPDAGLVKELSELYSPERMAQANIIR